MLPDWRRALSLVLPASSSSPLPGACAAGRFVLSDPVADPFNTTCAHNMLLPGDGRSGGKSTPDGTVLFSAENEGVVILPQQMAVPHDEVVQAGVRG